MKRENILASLGILSMAAMTLAGCGKNNATKDETKTIAKFPVETPIKTPKQGGVVKIAVETDTPFSGIFSNELSSEDVDA